MVPLRRSSGVTSVILLFAARAGLAGFATGTTQVVSACISRFLLLSGVKIVLAHGAAAGDAHVLRALTRIPQGSWSRLRLLGSLAVPGYGAAQLL
jgi:hypothetical protein